MYQLLVSDEWRLDILDAFAWMKAGARAWVKILNYV